MEKTEKSRRAGKISAVFHTLRFQVMAIMLLCYLIPAVLLGLFSETVLLPGIREKTDAALTAGVEHAWTMTVGNVEHAVALGREAIYDGELAEAYEQWRQGNMDDAEYLRVSRAYIERKYGRDDLFTFAAYFPISRPENYHYTPEELALMRRQANEAYLKWMELELEIMKYQYEQVAKQ